MHLQGKRLDKLAGVRGFEPRNAGIRIRCLPLGDTPTNWFLNLPNIFDTSEFGGYDGIRTCDPIIMSDGSNQLSYVARLFLRWLGYLDRTRECRYQKPVPYRLAIPQYRAVNRLLEEYGWGTWIRTRDAGIKNRCLTAWRYPIRTTLLVNGAGGET